jgi:Holliday junction resolvasome RuvABC ATP-dependent DNA helicase subunit
LALSDDTVLICGFEGFGRTRLHQITQSQMKIELRPSKKGTLLFHDGTEHSLA